MYSGSEAREPEEGGVSALGRSGGGTLHLWGAVRRSGARLYGVQVKGMLGTATMALDYWTLTGGSTQGKKIWTHAPLQHVLLCGLKEKAA